MLLLITYYSSFIFVIIIVVEILIFSQQSKAYRYKTRTIASFMSSSSYKKRNHECMVPAPSSLSSSSKLAFFKATATASEAKSLTDGVEITMPSLSLLGRTINNNGSNVGDVCNVGGDTDGKVIATNTVDEISSHKDNNGNSNKRNKDKGEGKNNIAVSRGDENNNWDHNVGEEEKVVLPYVGFGTYRLGKGRSYEATLDSLRVGYRCIDTAFIYGGETTEKQVGDAIHSALHTEKIIASRRELFLITKHWRNYHGYEATIRCLNLSLERLQVDYVDLYLMHWPGPSYKTMFRSKEILEGDGDGPWYYSTVPEHEMVTKRAETWRAMEDSYKAGKVRAIGVSNFTIRHLETLKRTATIWPPAVNQVECHPLYPQNELRDYCRKEGVVLQAYGALGGQDGTKAKWRTLALPGTSLKSGRPKPGVKLIECDAVAKIAKELKVTNGQVLLRYALQRNCAVTPKTVSIERMKENAALFHFQLSSDQMMQLDSLEATGDEGRLCWRTDPLRMLDFN